MHVLRVISGTILALALAACQTTAQEIARADQSLELSGSIDTSFDGIGVSGIEIRINDRVTTLDESGNFTASVPEAPYYRITATGEGIYTVIQTFGMTELYRKDCDCLRAPAIDVVARKPGRVGLFFAGDAMAGRRYVEPIWDERQLIDPADPLPDMRKLLDPMKPYIESADLSSVNLEIVLSEKDFGNSPPKSVVFYAHPALAQALKEAGFDHVSLGNNHSYDYLEEGLVTTIDAVEAAGLAWSGAGHDEKQALKASRLSAEGQDLCLLGYVGWKGRVEPNQVAEAQKGGAAYGSDANIAASVAREADTACAVIAQYHGSREYSEGPTEESERRMKLAVDEGAALLASHHPHVAHGVEIYRGSLIAYSSGNFLFDQYFLETHGAFAFRAWLDDGRFTRAEIIPLRVLDYRPIPAVGSMREAVLERVTRLSAGHGTRVGRDGGHGVVTPDSALAASAMGEAQEGLDLLRGGDFESAVFGDAMDRSLKVSGGVAKVEFLGRGGHQLRITPEDGASEIAIMPSTFLRVFPGKTITVSGAIKAQGAVGLALDYQQRPKGVSRFKALLEEPHVEAAQQALAAKDGWQEFSLTFELPDEADLPFRPILRIANGSGEPILLDNLKIVSSPR